MSTLNVCNNKTIIPINIDDHVSWSIDTKDHFGEINSYFCKSLTSLTEVLELTNLNLSSFEWVKLKIYNKVGDTKVKTFNLL